MPYMWVVEEISCDKCGYNDTPDKFPETPREIYERHALFCAGVICPVCGNFSDFDLDPNGKIQQGCAKLEFVP